MKAKIMIILTMFMTGSLALAHGENAAGPNGGLIRMPGAYHTEVIGMGDKLRVYLLDINWKNPTVKDSKVKARLTGKTKAATTCTPENDYFICSFKPGTTLNSGKLILETIREKQKGALATYPLPLKLPDEVKAPAPAPATAPAPQEHKHH